MSLPLLVNYVGPPTHQMPALVGLVVWVAAFLAIGALIAAAVVLARRHRSTTSGSGEESLVSITTQRSKDADC